MIALFCRDECGHQVVVVAVEGWVEAKLVGVELKPGAAFGVGFVDEPEGVAVVFQAEWLDGDVVELDAVKCGEEVGEGAGQVPAVADQLDPRVGVAAVGVEQV